MKTLSKRISVCSMMAAVGVVVMLLGAVLGLGMYVCPVIVGLCLIPIGRDYGTKYQIMLWIVISILSFILVPNPEENLMFAGLFGWYPALWPKLQKLPKLLRLLLKLLLFNVIVIAIEALVMLVLVPEIMGTAMLLVLLVLGNIVFLLYDKLIPRFDIIARRYLKKAFHKG